MKKRVIRLTESDFINIINDSVRRIIKENIEENQMEGNLQDVINGLYENGSDTQTIDSEGDCVATLEILGESGIVYFVDVTLNVHYEYTPSTYYEPSETYTDEEVVNVNIVYYDEENNPHLVEYVKDEDFEEELLRYINVDYSDYSEDNHYQYPDYDR